MVNLRVIGDAILFNTKMSSFGRAKGLFWVALTGLKPALWFTRMDNRENPTGQ
jgi:hypothetical protein